MSAIYPTPAHAPTAAARADGLTHAVARLQASLHARRTGLRTLHTSQYAASRTRGPARP